MNMNMNMFKKHNRRWQNGFTLVELIITISILGLVIGAIFTFQQFGSKVFNKGITQSDIQSSLRLTSNFILNEVRNATDIRLSTPANPSDYYQIYVSGNKLKYKPLGGTVIDKTDAIIENPSTDFLFSLVKIGSNYTLNFSMKGTSQTNSYNVSSDIMLNNIKTASLIANSQTLYYKKGFTIAAPSPGPGPGPSPGPSPGPPVAISIPDITLTVPVHNQDAQTTVNSTQFSGTISWRPFESNGKFKNNTTYTATITLTAKEGFTLSEVERNFFKVSGATTVNNNARSGVVTAVFP